MFPSLESTNMNPFSAFEDSSSISLDDSDLVSGAGTGETIEMVRRLNELKVLGCNGFGFLQLLLWEFTFLWEITSVGLF